MPYTQNRNLGTLGNLFFTSNFERSCNLDAKTTKNLPRQKLKGQDMLLLKKVKISEVSEFSILSYTQNRKLENIGKRCFTSNFDSSCNLRFRNNKNQLRQKLKVIKWMKKKKRKLPRFPSFRFSSILKIENSEILESVLLLQILTVVVIYDSETTKMN